MFTRISNVDTVIFTSDISGNHGYTDHFPTVALLEIQNARSDHRRTVTTSYFTAEGHKQRRNGLKNKNWHDFFSETDPNKSYDILLNNHSFHYHSAITVKSFNACRNKQPKERWMTMEILKKIKGRDWLSKNKDCRAEYKRLRYEIVSDCRKAEFAHNKKRISDSWNNVKEQWEILKINYGQN